MGLSVSDIIRNFEAEKRRAFFDVDFYHSWRIDRNSEKWAELPGRQSQGRGAGRDGYAGGHNLWAFSLSKSFSIQTTCA